VEQRRRLVGSLELSLQSFPPRVERLDLGVTLIPLRSRRPASGQFRKPLRSAVERVSEHAEGLGDGGFGEGQIESI